MSFLKTFSFQRSVKNPMLPEIYPFSLEFNYFVLSDLQAIFNKILTDVIDRTHGITNDIYVTLWDNCLANEQSKGLISLLTDAIVKKADLFLIYIAGIVRRADQEEAQTIRNDYEQRGYSDLGIYCSFKNFAIIDMLKIYSEMEYSLLNALNKNLNISKSAQIKISKLRDTVSLIDRDEARAQASNMISALAEGRSIMMDKEDEIEFSSVDMAPIRETIAFLDSKRAFYLNMPISYINGQQTTGIGTTGEADSKAIERGLKNYYISIIQPVLKSLYGINTQFKSKDFRQINNALEAVKTFEMVSDELINQETKQQIIRNLFDIDTEE